MDCDFADLFEVKDALQKKGSYDRSIEDGCLVLQYERETFRRATRISTTAEGDFDENGLTLAVSIEPHGRWTTEIQVEVSGAAMELVPRSRARTHAKMTERMQKSLETWLGKAPKLESDSDSLRATYHRSLVDLAALRFELPILPGHYLPAAGLPWFMTVFGRDSIITSLQALPFASDLAATTLRARSPPGRAHASTISGTRIPVESFTRCATAS